MKKSNLYSYSIMPLNTDHLEEICQDIKHQYENGIASCALFCMTLVPEGDPPADKVGLLCEKYAKFRDRLKEMGLSCGVLVQASVGHGWVLGDMFPYQTHVNFTDGVATRVVCPTDNGFKDYIRNVMATITSYRPDCITQLWGRFIQRTDLPYIRLHDLRHTNATLLIANDVSARVVQHRLGHADVSTTLQRYVHVQPAMDEAAADKIDSAIFD